MQSDVKREFLRHTLATLAYRGAKALRDAPETFAGFRTGPTARTPAEILAHVGDLFDWALNLARGKRVWHDSQPLPWDQGVRRFHAGLAAFDAFLASNEPLSFPPEQLFQGPVADALTHVGQLAMLRRMAGAPSRGENYFVAKIEVGQVGPDQAPPVREFD